MREKLIELLNAVDGVCPKDASCYDCEYKDVTHCAIPAKADYLIANGVTVQCDKDNNVPVKWISVKDRLPDCADTVVAVDRCGIMSTAYYVGYWHGGGDLDEYAVTHWMPLPQPPNEVEQ